MAFSAARVTALTPIGVPGQVYNFTAKTAAPTVSDIIVIEDIGITAPALTGEGVVTPSLTGGLITSPAMTDEGLKP